MEINQRSKAFSELGVFLKSILEEKAHAMKDQFGARFNQEIEAAIHYNAWFTKENVLKALDGIALMLSPKKLNDWLKQYDFKKEQEKNIGVIMAGNIPMVGFHDALCILVSGNIMYAKLSSGDKRLLPLLMEVLVQIEPAFQDRIHFIEQLPKDLQAIICTGSNNTSRYFEYYFGKYPNIIRKNRNAVAVLRGTESIEELKKIGEDIFSYFGLGCRNISKIFIPKAYDFDILFQAIYNYKYVIDYHKYANNYDYNKTVYLMGKEKSLLENGFLLLKEDIGIASPVGTLFYEYYEDEEQLNQRLKMDKDNIQCIVSEKKKDIPFGKSQRPELADYADGVDTMAFLERL